MNFMQWEQIRRHETLEMFILFIYFAQQQFDILYELRGKNIKKQNTKFHCIKLIGFGDMLQLLITFLITTKDLYENFYVSI